MEMNKRIGECGWYKDGVWVSTEGYRYSYHGRNIEKWMIGCKFQGDICSFPTGNDLYRGLGIITFEDGRHNESFSGVFNTTCWLPDRIQIVRNQCEFVTYDEKCEYSHGNSRVDVMPYLRSGEIKSCDVIECRDAIRRILSAGVKHKNSLCDMNVECNIVFTL